MAIVGRWVAPNLTTGKGSVTSTTRRPTGITLSGMACGEAAAPRQCLRIEFTNLSDHELSDIVAYIRSMPPVDRRSRARAIRTGFRFYSRRTRLVGVCSVGLTSKAHAVEPPAAAPTAEFGEHLVQVCRGCHGPRLSGGKLEGDPDMPIVANLTPHETGLKDWTEADFMRALREGKRKDGTRISERMPWKAYGQMSDDGAEGDLRVPADGAAEAERQTLSERQASASIALRMAAMCSGVLPQQPPMMLTPSSATCLA